MIEGKDPQISLNCERKKTFFKAFAILHKWIINESLWEMCLLSALPSCPYRHSPVIYTTHQVRISCSILCKKIHEWCCCCCAIDCGTSDVRMSLFPWKTVSDVSKFLYFRPIWKFMNVCDRPTTAVLKPQSVSSPHTFSVVQNASSWPKFF